MRHQTSDDAVTRIIGPGDIQTAISVRTFAVNVVAGPNKGAAARATGTELLIGTGDGCDLLLDGDDTVSRSHCLIKATDDGFLLRDLESTNGTWIRDLRIERAYLTPGTEIGVGRSRLRFTVGDERIELPLSPETSFHEIIGVSPAMRDVFARLARVSPTDLTVLLEGESGTGKELAARAIHHHSHRAAGPLEILDCGAAAPSVIESELFGHEKGAFTGASAQYRGVFERAHGGTLFIDEIGELRPDLQPKLLRVLEARELRRVGGSKPIPCDVRVVAATNRDLRPAVNRGSFRLDLFFRLAGVRIEMPPLRARTEDIPLLVRHFADRFAERNQTPAPRGAISDETLDLLARHPWPGNVRELRNFVEQTLVLAELSELPGAAPPADEDGLTVRTDLPYKEARELLLDAFCRAYFGELLLRNKYNITHTATEAGIDRVYAQRVVKKYGLK